MKYIHSQLKELRTPLIPKMAKSSLCISIFVSIEYKTKLNEWQILINLHKQLVDCLLN